MKVSEKTISIWTVVQLYKDTKFKNYNWSGSVRMQRIENINKFDTWDIRYWREFFCQFSEPVMTTEQGFVPDEEKQLDMEIEQQIDQQVIL